MASKINRYGKAATMVRVCVPDIPPDKIRAKAIMAKRMPQKIFLSFGGSKLPSEVIIARTKVAEFAEVTKKVNNRREVLFKESHKSFGKIRKRLTGDNT